MKNVAFIVPVSSATVASTSGRMPRRRTGRDEIALTWTTTVALSPGDELRHRARLPSIARQMLEQVADRVQPEDIGRVLGLRAVEAQRRAEAGRARVGDRRALKLSSSSGRAGEGVAVMDRDG